MVSQAIFDGLAAIAFPLLIIAAATMASKFLQSEDKNSLAMIVQYVPIVCLILFWMLPAMDKAVAGVPVAMGHDDWESMGEDIDDKWNTAFNMLGIRIDAAADVAAYWAKNPSEWGEKIGPD